MKLAIQGITNPYAVFSGYNWIVRTQRFQTKTIIEETNTVTSNLSTIVGTMRAATYVSSWGQTSTNVPANSKLFMDSSFSIQNPVYERSTATITFADDVDGVFPNSGHGGTNVTCYMVDAFRLSDGVTWTTCSASNKTVTVTDLKYGPSGTIYKFRVLATLNGSSSKIATVTTKTSGTEEIDVGNNMAAFARSPPSGAGSITNVVASSSTVDVGVDIYATPTLFSKTAG